MTEPLGGKVEPPRRREGTSPGTDADATARKRRRHRAVTQASGLEVARRPITDETRRDALAGREAWPTIAVLGAGDAVQHRVQIRRAEFRIGRAPICDVVLSARSISRLHASIVAEGNGHSFVPIAANHLNWINGAPVAAPVALADGDVIDLDGTRLVYVAAAVEGRP